MGGEVNQNCGSESAGRSVVEPIDLSEMGIVRLGRYLEDTGDGLGGPYGAYALLNGAVRAREQSDPRDAEEMDALWNGTERRMNSLVNEYLNKRLMRIVDALGGAQAMSQCMVPRWSLWGEPLAGKSLLATLLEIGCGWSCRGSDLSHLTGCCSGIVCVDDDIPASTKSADRMNPRQRRRAEAIAGYINVDQNARAELIFHDLRIILAYFGLTTVWGGLGMRLVDVFACGRYKRMDFLRHIEPEAFLGELVLMLDVPWQEEEDSVAVSSVLGPRDTRLKRLMRELLWRDPVLQEMACRSLLRRYSAFKVAPETSRGWDLLLEWRLQQIEQQQRYPASQPHLRRNLLDGSPGLEKTPLLLLTQGQEPRIAGADSMPYSDFLFLPIVDIGTTLLPRCLYVDLRELTRVIEVLLPEVNSICVLSHINPAVLESSIAYAAANNRPWLESTRIRIILKRQDLLEKRVTAKREGRIDIDLPPTVEREDYLIKRYSIMVRLLERYLGPWEERREVCY